MDFTHCGRSRSASVGEVEGHTPFLGGPCHRAVTASAAERRPSGAPPFALSSPLLRPEVLPEMARAYIGNTPCEVTIDKDLGDNWAVTVLPAAGSPGSRRGCGSRRSS